MRKGLVLLSAVLVLAGCSGLRPQPDTHAEDGTPAEITLEPLANVVGSLADAAASANLVIHSSRSGIDDSPSDTTTSVFVPKGDAPAEGFRIIALGHQATGIAPECAPSMSPDLFGLAPAIEALLNAGYVVTVPDYQGLGKPSLDAGSDANKYYPYLESTTAGYNMVDAVQATHKAIPQTSASWLAMGAVEGGQAAWAANELVDNYGYDLELVGSVSISPVSAVTGLADAAQDASLNDQQKVALARFLAATSKAYPGGVDLDEFRRGAAQQHWDALVGCQGDPSATQVAAQIPAADLRPATPQALATLRGYLQKTTLPQGPAQTPMLVSFSGTEPLSPAAWTDAALDAACKLGDTITIRKDPDPRLDSAATLGWIADRFDGSPAQNDCEGRTR